MYYFGKRMTCDLKWERQVLFAVVVVYVASTVEC